MHQLEAVNKRKSLLWHNQELFRLGVDRFVELTAGTKNIDRQLEEQKGEGRYYSWPDKVDLQKLKKLW